MFPQGLSQGYQYNGGAAAQQSTSYLSNLQSQVQQGIIPSLDKLTTDLTQLSPPESQQGQALMMQTYNILQQAGPQGLERTQQLALKLAEQQLKNTTGSLFTISGNLDPKSPEAQQLEARKAAIKNIEDNLHNQLTQSLDKDPTHGGTIDLRGNGGGDNSLLDMMLQMMQMMMSLLTNQLGGQQK